MNRLESVIYNAIVLKQTVFKCVMFTTAYNFLID